MSDRGSLRVVVEPSGSQRWCAYVSVPPHLSDAPGVLGGALVRNVGEKASASTYPRIEAYDRNPEDAVSAVIQQAGRLFLRACGPKRPFLINEPDATDEKSAINLAYALVERFPPGGW